MALTTPQVQQLITLLIPAFLDESTRKALLFMAFPNDPTKPGQFDLSQPAQAFATEVVRKLYSNNRADLLVLLQVVQEFMGGDLSRSLQPFVETLGQPTTGAYAAAPATHKHRLKIFVSYRRKSWSFTHRLVDDLKKQINADLFVDFRSIDETNFEHSILRHLRESDAVLLVVSEHTFTERIHQPDDWLRREIREALKANKPIILVRAEGQAIPDPSDLPEDIRDVVKMQGISIYPDFWHEGVKKLGDFIKLVLRPSSSSVPVLVPIVAGVALLVVIGIIVGLAGRGNGSSPLTAPTLIPAGTSNTVWTPQSQAFNGVIMVLVPAGCFRMGSDNDASDEKPVHEVCFEQPFWMDKYEVTQAQFKQFGGKATNASYFTGTKLPVEQITWFESKAFCEAQGGRLPTEAEWEYAARGPEGLTYPWGNTFEGSRVSYCDANCDSDWKDKLNDDGYKNTAPVGNYSGGISWVGALDMSGNVWEWVSSLYQSYPYKADDGRESTSNTNSARVLRGGGWVNDELNLRAGLRFRFTPSGGSDDVGFRCARSHQ